MTTFKDTLFFHGRWLFTNGGGLPASTVEGLQTTWLDFTATQQKDGLPLDGDFAGGHAHVSAAGIVSVQPDARVSLHCISRHILYTLNGTGSVLGWMTVYKVSGSGQKFFWMTLHDAAPLDEI